MNAAHPSSGESFLDIRLERPFFKLEAQLEWDRPALVLFGPSGSGKTTLLRVMLGLEPAAHARIRLGGTWLVDPEQGLDLPAHHRQLGWVPQSPTLFPDRNVRDNIRFGASSRGANPDLERAIDVLELREHLASPVDELSGGEKQRVAIARAIAGRPRALLLDEPLASLDLSLRGRVLPFLMRLREELALPIIHITHDPDEAILLGDEVAVLDQGRIVAHGDPRKTLWSRAVLPLTAHLGLENWIETRGIDCETGLETNRVHTREGLTLETLWAVGAGEHVCLGIRGEDILIAVDPPGRLSARNVIAGRIERIETQNLDARVHVDCAGEEFVAKLTTGAIDDLALTAGRDVFLIIKSQALHRI